MSREAHVNAVAHLIEAVQSYSQVMYGAAERQDEVRTLAAEATGDGEILAQVQVVGLNLAQMIISLEELNVKVTDYRMRL